MSRCRLCRQRRATEVEPKRDRPTLCQLCKDYKDSQWEDVTPDVLLDRMVTDPDSKP